MSRKVKSVSFNRLDPFENKMYEFTETLPNFSSYVKRLIQNAMGGKSESLQKQPVQQNVNQVENVEINPEHLRKLI
jgi:hypothetical protein